MGKSIKTTCDRTEYALENNKFPTPVILYRSVGLQVNTGNVVQRLSGKLISGKGPETNGFTDLRKLNGFRAPPIPRPVPVANVPRPGLDIRQNRFKPPNSVGHSSKNILGSVSYTSPATYIGTPLPQPYTPNIITKNSGIGRLNASQGMKNAQSGFIEQLVGISILYMSHIMCVHSIVNLMYLRLATFSTSNVDTYCENC